MKKLRIAMPTEWAREPACGWRPLFARPLDDRFYLVPRGAWKSLFNGTNLDGWTFEEDTPDQWQPQAGTLYCKGKGGGYLRSVEQFENFVLAIEFKIEKGTNSGVFVRWSNPKDPVNTGIEIQIIDSVGKAKPDKHDCGAIYDLVAPSSNPIKPIGEWNQFLIACQGPNIAVAMNGVAIAEVDLSPYRTAHKNPDGTENKFNFAMASLPRKGYLGLQNHGGPLWFRNMLILPL